MAKLKDESKTTETTKPAPVKEKQQLISSKMFAKTLRKELKDEDISETVYIAFEKSVQPMIDSEKNFREKWNKSFKRS